MGRYLGLRYFFIRLLSSCVAVAVLITMSFFLVETLPGSPFQQEEGIDPVVLSILQEKYGYDQPVGYRYIKFIESIFCFEVGPSVLQEATAPEFFKARAENSIILGSFAFIIALGLALVSSLWVIRTSAAIQWFWRISHFLLALPILVLVPLVISVFAIWLNWFPVARLDGASSFVLPVLVLSMRPFLQFSRILVQQMEQESQSLAVLGHRALGFTPGQTLLKVILPNSLIPLLMALPNSLSSLLSGSIVVEAMFAIPGLGSTFLEALLARDAYIISLLVVGGGVLLILSQLLVDLLLIRLDPRVSLEAR